MVLLDHLCALTVNWLVFILDWYLDSLSFLFFFLFFFWSWFLGS